MNEECADLLWQRDRARAEAIRLRAENEHLRVVIKFADAAVQEEFRLRKIAMLDGDVER